MNTPPNSNTDNQILDRHTVIVNGQRISCTRQPGSLTFFLELTSENRHLDMRLPDDVPPGRVQIWIEPLSSPLT